MKAIDIITQKIERLSTALEALEEVRGEMLRAEGEAAPALRPSVPLPPEEPVSEAPTAGKAKPAAKDRQPAPGGERKGDQRDERRRSIARLLSTELLGPSELANRLNIPKGGMGDLLKHPWFEKDGPELKAPYRLTEAGRAALRSSPPTPNPT